MNRKIAVEQSLTPVKDFLVQKGYSVDSVNFSKEFTGSMDEYDAVVVTGVNENFLGVEDTNTKAAVINARGLTAEEIQNLIEKKLQ
jgi:galactitol-specific phosphotransferase system IIB component